MSSSFVHRTAVAAAVAVGSLAFFGASASAQTCYPPTDGCVTTTTGGATARPTLTLSANTVVRGQTITARVAGFQPGTSGTLFIAEQQVGSFTVPASGSTTTNITIPANIALGGHTVVARGTALGGQPGVASQGIIVVAGNVAGGGGTGGGGGGGGGSRGNLARTGATVGVATIVGVGLVAGGLALKRSGRRKASSTA